MLVRRGRCAPADAGCGPGLPVPRLLAQGGGSTCKRDGIVSDNWHIRAFLLDMDGTLLDTERVYFESLLAAMNALGYSDDIVALCHAMVGLPGPSM
jgi:hypothetical protein